MGNAWPQQHPCYDDEAILESHQVNLKQVRHLYDSAAVEERYHFGGERTLETDYRVSSEVLGQGSCGEVVAVHSRLDDCRYALKTLRKAGERDAKVQQLLWEAEIHLAMDHPNIAGLEGVYENETSISMVTEYCDGGELYSALQKKGTYGNDEAAEATWQILSAVQHLHSRNIVHRDLKLENFLYKSKDKQQDINVSPGEESAGNLKLIDFGFARVWEESTLLMTPCGTTDYASPELLSFEGYTTKTDMWSIGVIVWMLLAGYPPFHGDKDAILAKIVAGCPDWSYGTRWGRVSKDAKDLVCKLLTKNPEERLDARRALWHPWLALAGLKANAPSATLSAHRDDVAGAKLRCAALRAVVQQLDRSEVQKLRLACFGVHGGADDWICPLSKQRVPNDWISVHQLKAVIQEVTDSGQMNMSGMTQGRNLSKHEDLLASLGACCPYGVTCFDLMAAMTATWTATCHHTLKSHDRHRWLASCARGVCSARRADGASV